MQADKIWQAALGELQMQVSRANYNTWLRDTNGVDFSGGVFTVAVPTSFIAEWLKGRLSSLIIRTISTIVGQNAQVQFVVHSMAKEPMRASAGLMPDGGVSLKERITAIKLNSFNPRYTFDSFVSGDCNRISYTAAMEISDNPGSVFNPLFIYGGTGTGKTHLLHAIGHMLKKNNFSSLYVSSEQFTNEFIAAIRNRKAEEFRYSFNHFDVLLLDDIQFLSGKVQTQECIFHVLNDFLDDNRQVVITCDRSPNDIESLNTRLMSRLEGGLLADLYPPDHKTRLAILELKSQQIKSSFDLSVLNYVATNFHRNVRELEGALLRLVTYARLNKSGVDMMGVKSVLGDMIAASKQGDERYTPGEIINAVAEYFSVPRDDITSPKRDLKTSRARHIAMYLLRQQNHCSLSEIGKLLGGRDHSTVIHGCEKISSSLSLDAQLSKSIEEIRKSLKSA